MAKVMVGKASDIGEGKMAHFTVGGKEILIANIRGQYYATSNTCTHAGAELHEGALDGRDLICPWHGAKWDVTTGNLLWFPQKLQELGHYEVMIENGTMYVEV
ncbi:MAG TPA: Rieske 2Fe-2S domain-containing protein [Nitrososphaera sp.]|jgi:nitrite reductase/ring-hydroxylating ferredoxin subunit|nr:Rieske 2Fe-2S domain-containing protein [Nitrososphaera sp.]